jgi:hypothetical protein
MPDNPQSGLIEPRVLRIFVAYDQPEAGARAETLCTQIEDAKAHPFEVQSWRFSTIAAGEAGVGNTATHADMLVIAWSTPAGPPENLFKWVLDWAVQRSVANATLAALPVGAALAGTGATPILHRLRQLATAAGLTFACDWTEGLTLRQQEAAPTLQDREQIMTPTLVGILAERHSHPHLHWGLNE